jgi:methanogenic corrinoid protein MtbC1
VNQELIVERLFQALISGDRAGARQIVSETRQQDITAEDLSHEVYWATLDMINTLFRNDQLTTLAHHYAVRILRTLIDQAQVEYAQNVRRKRTVCMFCGPSEADELAGQLTADLIEADGYDVLFGGGGIAADEIMSEVGERRPDILLMWSSAPQDAPHIRQMIDSIRGVNACPHMQIVVGGGVFNRAPGLAEEIGADLWARTPRELLDALVTQSARRASEDQRTVGRNRKTAPAEPALRRSAAA